MSAHSASPGAPQEVNHWRRCVLWWLGISIVGTLLVVLVLAPGMPPGTGTVESSGQVWDNAVLLGASTPVAAAVLVFMTYSLIAFRERQPGAVLDGPRVLGDARLQTWWLVVTTGLVLGLAAFGTVELERDGAGGGQGPTPLSTPGKGTHVLQVQVIAQQWKFDFRWPAYGGVETPALNLPAHTTVEFHVTSLDVIHSFWAYQLGVKADANPGVDNVAYVTTKSPMSFNVHCDELCGVWHGYMFDSGRVVPKAQFASWIAQQQKTYAPAAKALPPYSLTYAPQPTRRGG
jgi:cytochrome c oxidase subunit 2